MRNFIRVTARYFGLLFFVSTLGGCGVQNIRVDKEYSKRISEAKLQFAQPKNVKHTISAEVRYGPITLQIQAGVANVVQLNIREMQSILPPLIIKAAQEKSGLIIKTSGDAETDLILTLDHIETSLSPNYAHEIWYQVVLRDNRLGKEIWYGEFKFFTVENASGRKEYFAKFVDDFAESIAKEIAKSGVVK